MSTALAPCVAVVGPANSGKSALVGALDDYLHTSKAGILFHTVKGSPDGSGQYLYWNPELRDQVKGSVKGRWVEPTPGRIQQWIRNSRRHLDLVMLDLGGKRDRMNLGILRECSHCIVLARRFPDDVQEEADGANAWTADCRGAMLVSVACLESIAEGRPEVGIESGVIRGTFRGKVNDTDRNINQAVVETLASALGRLVATSRRNDYVDLDLGCRWEFQDVASLGGRGAVLDTVASTGRLLLGGRAPKWAYGAALVRGLHVNPNSTCCVFDPKLEEGFVEIPRSVKTVARSAMPLRAAWSSISEPEAAMLHITVATDDRMLSDPEPAGLSALPEPEGQPAQHGPLVLSGVGTPNWVDLAYVRWLSQRFPDREIGMWDAATERAVVIEPKTRTFTLRFTRPPGRPTKSNT